MAQFCGEFGLAYPYSIHQRILANCLGHSRPLTPGSIRKIEGGRFKLDVKFLVSSWRPDRHLHRSEGHEFAQVSPTLLHSHQRALQP